MAALSDYAESGILNLLLRGNTNTFAAPSNVSIALCSGVPIDSNTGATIPELKNGSSYARVSLGSPSDGDWDVFTTGGATANTSTATFPPATGNWGIVSGVAIVNNATHGAGQVLFHGKLTTARTVLNGDTFKFNAGDIDITLG